MGRIFVLVVLLLLYTCSSFQKHPAGNRGLEKQKYFNLEPPGEVPEIFSPGEISRGFHEHALSISPGFDEMLYVMTDINYQMNIIVDIRWSGSRWNKPQVASFSGIFKDMGGCFSADGKRFLFASQRPVDGLPGNRTDLWETVKTSGEWSKPVNIGPPVNTEAHEANPCFDKNDNLYFQSNRNGSWDIYFSEYLDGSYLDPAEVTEINTEFNESDPFISRDGSYILFHSNRGDPMGLMDLYVSFREESGWSKPVNLGDEINSPYSDFGPYVSPDGKYLFFSSYRPWQTVDMAGKSYKDLIRMYNHPMNGYAALYWVDASVIKKKRIGIAGPGKLH